MLSSPSIQNLMTIILHRSQTFLHLFTYKKKIQVEVYIILNSMQLLQSIFINVQVNKNK